MSINENGYIKLKKFIQFTKTLSKSKLAIFEKIAKKQGGTATGAAWAVFNGDKQYSPHSKNKKVTKNISKRVNNPKKSESLTNIKIVKNIAPGIKTIFYKIQKN